MKLVILIFALLGLTSARPQFQQFGQQVRQASSSFGQQFNQVSQSFGQQVRQTVQASPLAYILRYDSDLGTPTGFSYAVETSDGFNNAVIGEVKNPSPQEEEGSLAVEGQYSYVGDDGQTYTVHYTADENGFQPSGQHIPAAANTKKLGIPSAALASLAGGGLG